MNEFQGRVAVITGAGSGIGLSLTRRCAQEGMKVVLADIDVPALNDAAAELQAFGSTILTVPADVAKAGDVEELAYKTLAALGSSPAMQQRGGRYHCYHFGEFP